MKSKGLGLLTKLVLFSIVPAYCILGVILYYYHSDLKQGITQKYIENAILAASVIQSTVPYDDFQRAAPPARKSIQEAVKSNTDFLKATIYADRDGQLQPIASTGPVGDAASAREDDVQAIRQGRTIVMEHRERAPPSLEVLAPYRERDRVRGAIGITFPSSPRDALVGYLFTRVLWIVLPGSAIILLVVFYVVHRIVLSPIGELAKGAHRFTQGDLGYRIPVRSHDEASQLSQSFNTMAASLHLLMEQFEQKEETLKRQTLELARSNADLEQFAYVASHDLQEPLRVVAGHAQLFSQRYQGKLDAEADDMIGRVVNGAFRMQQLINDLLIYSRVGTHGKGPQPTDCSAVLDEVLANLKTSIEESGATVTAEPLPSVMADRTQLKQLFQNLIDNAIKYRGTQPVTVHVRARQHDKEWVFAVQDNGIGIHPDDAQRIFVLFQRLHADEEYPGTGIGLSICQKIVERHGGRIWVESEPYKGSTFYFTLPA